MLAADVVPGPVVDVAQAMKAAEACQATHTPDHVRERVGAAAVAVPKGRGSAPGHTAAGSSASSSAGPIAGPSASSSAGPSPSASAGSSAGSSAGAGAARSAHADGPVASERGEDGAAAPSVDEVHCKVQGRRGRHAVRDRGIGRSERREGDREAVTRSAWRCIAEEHDTGRAVSGDEGDEDKDAQRDGDGVEGLDAQRGRDADSSCCSGERGGEDA
jgi:hypothetical protein